MSQPAPRRLRLLALTPVVLAALFFTVLPVSQVTAAVDPAPKVDAAQLREHLDRLGEVLDQRLERLERLPAEQRPSEAEREADATGFRRYLSALEAMVRRAALAGEEQLLSRFRALERRVGELERWSESSVTAATAPPAPVPAVTPGDPRKDAPANDFCAAALPIGIGSVSGSTLGATSDTYASCDSFYSPDVWYRFSSPLTGRLYATATSTEFEPVISIFNGCTRLGEEYLGCGEVAPIDAEAGTEYFVRVSGRAGGSGSFTLDLASGGSIRGTVTDAATGAPLPAVTLAGPVDGYVDLFASTATDGGYAFDDLGPGTYRVFIAAAGIYLPEVYDDEPCLPNVCYSTPGTPVTVAFGQDVTGIDFALGIGGALSGTVTDAATGDPIAEVGVGILDSGRARLAWTDTDAAGRYTFSGLYPGSYFVLTASDGQHLNELYDDVPCRDGYWGYDGCNFTTATAVPVTLGDPTVGIDFALERSGSISGTVTEAATGDPIPYIGVEVVRAGSSTPRVTVTDGDGNYTVSGLLSGVYLAQTNSYSAQYLDEMYDDQPCLPECDRVAATQITVHLGETTSGIDFSLRRLGAITGAVTDSATGAPLSGISVFVRDEAGAFIEREEAIDGRYRFEGLAPENYFLSTSSYDSYYPRYLDELYDDLPCPRSQCVPTSGTPVRADLDEVTSGIDFALAAPPTISGRVTLDPGGEPLARIYVSVSQAEGNPMGLTSTDETGAYTFYLDAPGTYFVWTGDYGGSLPLYYNEVYDNVLCSTEEGCDLTLGTPITIGPSEAVTGIDFALSPRSLQGVISGTVTPENRIGYSIEAYVTVWDESGSQVARVVNYSHYSIGPYRVVLAPGRYYLTASAEYLTHLAELYDNLPCPFELCDPTAGTPITVGIGSQTYGIDFTLAEGGSVAGRVTDDLGEPVALATLELWDSDARSLMTTSTGYEGHFVFSGLETGSYFVTTRTHSDLAPYSDEVFDNLPCSTLQGCDPTIGAPIAVTVPATTPNVDFTLTPLVNCSASATTLCLNAGRFRVEVDWSDFEQGGGRATGHQITGETGYFTFLDPDNVEVVVKVLNACDQPTPRYWVYAGGLTNLGVALTVTDTATGQSRRYDNPLGSAFELIRDTGFTSCGVGFMETDAVTADPSRSAWQLARSRTASVASSGSLASPAKTTGTCFPDATTLCLAEGRFAVTALISDFDSFPDPAFAVPLTADAGYFIFLSFDNVEVVIKVLDACGLDPFHNFWVFAAGLTDLEVELRVRDTVSGEEQVYTNAFGEAFVPIQDTAHFATCP